MHRGLHTQAMDDPSQPARPQQQPPPPQPPGETGGQPGPEPTRYGDWEHKGRCSDF
ncbi:MAG: DUF1674 domain-containing protein [Alphaproteobacteria bacterium]